MHSNISYFKVLDRVAPIKQVRMKQRSEPLMDGHILDLINQRDQALHNFQKSKIADHFKHFCKLRKKVQYSFRKAKRHFYNNKIEDHKNSSSDFWKALILLGTSSKLKSGSTSIGLDVDGSTTFDKLKVADTFNEFLTTVANKLVSKLPTSVNISNSNFIHQYYKQKKLFKMLYLPYFQTANFCLHTVNEKYLLILSEYFMPKPSSDSTTDVIPYCSLVFLRAYMITG